MVKKWFQPGLNQKKEDADGYVRDAVDPAGDDPAATPAATAAECATAGLQGSHPNNGVTASAASVAAA